MTPEQLARHTCILLQLPAQPDGTFGVIQEVIENAIRKAVEHEQRRCIKAAEQGRVPCLSGFGNADLNELRADIIRRIKGEQQ